MLQATPEPRGAQWGQARDSSAGVSGSSLTWEPSCWGCCEDGEMKTVELAQRLAHILVIVRHYQVPRGGVSPSPPASAIFLDLLAGPHPDQRQSQD